VSSPPPGPQTRILLITEDDDVGEPLADLLRRAGYSVVLADGGEETRMLAGGGEGPAASGGRYPEALILDRDLPVDRYQAILDRLVPRAGPASFPLLVIGGGPKPPVPAGWHEDAYASVSRPPQPAEILATLSALRRLVFYRRYRDLVHDLAQPVMTLHALSQGIAKLEVKDEAARRTIERLVHEAERLMSLMERFQRGRGAP
jgi:DNA-binding response OmpR family regulator